MSRLLYLIPDRKVKKDSLTINIYEGAHQDDTSRSFTYGETVVNVINIYLDKHFSDIHFLSTLTHEYCHFLTWHERAAHGRKWKACGQRTMALVNSFVRDIPLLDSSRHELCLRVGKANFTGFIL